jgi:hypothetical protein
MKLMLARVVAHIHQHLHGHNITHMNMCSQSAHTHLQLDAIGNDVVEHQLG